MLPCFSFIYRRPQIALTAAYWMLVYSMALRRKLNRPGFKSLFDGNFMRSILWPTHLLLLRIDWMRLQCSSIAQGHFIAYWNRTWFWLMNFWNLLEMVDYYLRVLDAPFIHQPSIIIIHMPYNMQANYNVSYLVDANRFKLRKITHNHCQKKNVINVTGIGVHHYSICQQQQTNKHNNKMIPESHRIFLDFP